MLDIEGTMYRVSKITLLYTVRNPHNPQSPCYPCFVSATYMQRWQYYANRCFCATGRAAMCRKMSRNNDFL
jgi:hypothetical protein